MRAAVCGEKQTVTTRAAKRQNREESRHPDAKPLPNLFDRNGIAKETGLTAFLHSKQNRLRVVRKAAAFCAFSAGVLLACNFAARADDGTPLPTKLPKAAFVGTPTNSVIGPNVEKPLGHPRPVPNVPKGTVNLALHKKVISSATPFEGHGTLDMITDGDKEAKEGTAVELKAKVQWIQIDLGESAPLSYILMWHYHESAVVFHCVVAQVSNDPKFIDGVTTLFNNDIENKAGLGIGKDREYFETNEGKLIDARGIKARYVRLYSRGSTYDPLNRYTEVEVFGVPSK